jgi:hypothetical protein
VDFLLKELYKNRRKWAQYKKKSQTVLEQDPHRGTTVPSDYSEIESKKTIGISWRGYKVVQTNPHIAGPVYFDSRADITTATGHVFIII